MFASTITASPRKSSARTGLGAAAVIGYRSSRRASSSVLIVEISASTASTSAPVARSGAPHPAAPPARTAAAPGPPSSARSTHRGRAVRPRHSGSQPCRTAGSAPPATRPAASPPRPAGSPADAADPTASAWTPSTNPSCVYLSHKSMAPLGMTINDPGSRVSPRTSPPDPRSTADAPEADRLGRSTTAAPSFGHRHRRNTRTPCPRPGA